ncbi:MAG TPA: helix-turn-helix domain-containing protein [Polyangiaceae bacterium]|jgi:AcrR family transcriptional regulator
MPAPRSLDNDVRSATLVAAMRLFASHGFEGTALQDIADAVGVSKPAVLHHYPSKEHIRQAVLDSILEHWNLTLPRLLLAATASHDRFDAVVGELLRFFAADPDRARILLRETLDRPVEMRRMLGRVVRPWLSTVAQYVRVGKEAGRHYADVDDEAYVLHVIQLVVVATACGSVTSTVIEGDAGARYERELVRIARRSLFSPLAESRPARRTRRARPRAAE